LKERGWKGPAKEKKGCGVPGCTGSQIAGKDLKSPGSRRKEENKIEKERND